MPQLHDAGVVGLGTYQFQAGLPGEQRLAGADRDRVDVQDVLVDEAEPCEPLRGADAAWHTEVAAGLIPEPGNGRGQLVVTAGDDQLGIAPRQIGWPTGDDDAMQAVDGIGDGPAGGRRGRIGGDAFPVGDHALGDRVAEEASVRCPQQGNDVVVEALVGGAEHPVKLVDGTGDEAIHRGGHVQDHFPHGGVLRVPAMRG